MNSSSMPGPEKIRDLYHSSGWFNWKVFWRKGKNFTWKPFVVFFCCWVFPIKLGPGLLQNVLQNILNGQFWIRDDDWCCKTEVSENGPKQVIRIAALDRLEICAHTYTRGHYIISYYLSIYVFYTLYIFC